MKWNAFSLKKRVATWVKTVQGTSAENTRFGTILEKLYEENMIADLSEKGKRILIGSLSVCLGGAFLLGYTFWEKRGYDLKSAESAFLAWEKKPDDPSLFISMKKAFSKAPSIQKKYESAVAQKLFRMDQIQDALFLANRSIERVKKDVPYHASFAEGTLLIETHEFQKALESAVSLKEKMDSPLFSKGERVLYLYNLLRIAALQKELKNPAGEISAWDELELSLENPTPAAHAFIEDFKESHIDILEVIRKKKAELAPSQEDMPLKKA